MLRQRVITALILAPLAIWAILALPTAWFALLMGLIVVMGAWEWTRLVGLTGGGRVVYSTGVAVVLGLLYPLLAQSESMVAAGAVAVAWWLAALFCVVRFPDGTEFWRTRPAARALAGFFVLVPAWAALVFLQRVPGPGYVLLLVMLIWAADTGAYFAGRAFGRHKLAPRVSPGKTWEGVAGGALLALAVGAVGMALLEPAGGIAVFLLLCLVAVGFSILGDLSESMFKRIMNVKDSGGLLPGHGGVLDRIDSLTAAAPMFALGIYALGVLR